MALLDLSLVTRALILLVEESVAASPAWLPRPRPTVSPQPPDRLAADALGVYLYHMVEDPALKGLPATGSGHPAVRYTPMGLNLYYQLATGVAEDDAGAFQSQLLLGLAVKALHDFPFLNDGTELSGVNIFQNLGLDGEDNRFHLTLQPIPPTEAVSFWTAGTAPLRLAAYYQASVVLLEPESPTAKAGRVFTYGIHSFVTGAPRLEASENRLSFTIPGIAATQEVTLKPAEVPLGSPLTLRGTDLAGDETLLVLEHPDWAEPGVADPAWGVIAAPNRLLATVRETIDGTAVLPGLYSAAARVSRTKEMPDGSTRTFTQTSNRVPVTLTPRVDTPLPVPDGTGVFTVTGATFEHPSLAPEDVEVYLGPEILTPGTAGALAPGEYAVVDANTLEARLPGGLASGSFLPFRLVVRRAESAPAWVEVP